MPNRILRDWTDSTAVNKLSVHAERFFVRLIMKVDDYGLFWGSAGKIRPLLYPWLLNNVREADVERFLLECKEARLIRLYAVDGEQYLEIQNFRQRVRQDPKFATYEGWKPPNDNDLEGDVQRTAKRPSFDRQMTAQPKPYAQAQPKPPPKENSAAADVRLELEREGVSASKIGEILEDVKGISALDVILEAAEIRRDKNVRRPVGLLVKTLLDEGFIPRTIVSPSDVTALVTKHKRRVISIAGVEVNGCALKHNDSGVFLNGLLIARPDQLVPDAIKIAPGERSLK